MLISESISFHNKFLTDGINSSLNNKHVSRSTV